MKLMFQGTGSNVGKSMVVAGFCRAVKNRGLTVLPFKPQNMSNNAAVAMCEDGSGGEIGRAQWLQALACGEIAHVDMNPVLLKPQSETGAQIVVHGKVAGSADARQYQSTRTRLLKPIIESFERLKNRADIVVVEGAGSPAEINLRSGDIANMGFAHAGQVPVILVGDIDRGGVIAAMVGTHTVLATDDCQRIKGFIINKFRGDASLFDDGRKAIIGHTGWADCGLLPWLDIAGKLPEEDSVWFSNSCDHQQPLNSKARLKIAVPVTGRIANFDDFDPLAAEQDVNLVFVKKGEAIPRDAQLLVLAGSKSTLSDMAEIEANGWSAQIREFASNGGRIIGICAGYQMLGTTIKDPDNIEGSTGEIAGLGLLDIETVLEPQKTVRITRAHSIEYDVGVKGYEIHLGKTIGNDCRRPILSLDGVGHGASSDDGNISGCYLHGLFANDEYRARLIRSLGGQSNGENYLAGIDRALDELAEEIETHLDVDGLLQIANP